MLGLTLTSTPGLALAPEGKVALPAPDPFAPYVQSMALCESGNDPEAVNREDLDGTPSYGRFQFKPKTLLLFSLKYGFLLDVEELEIMNWIYDGEFQEDVFRRMIVDPVVDLYRQFPTCHRRHIALLPKDF